MEFLAESRARPFLRRGRFLVAALLVGLLYAANTATPCAAQNRAWFTRSAAPAGINTFYPGKWGVIAFDVLNTSEEPVEMLAAMYFDDPNVQYGRQLWVPPRAKRRSWHPVQLPLVEPKKNADGSRAKRPTRMQVKSLLVNRADEDILVESSGGQLLHDGLLPMTDELPLTGMLLDDGDDEPRRAIHVMRAVNDWTPRGAAALSPVDLPATVEALDALDHLVIASDRIAEDVAALVAVRRWLAGGGRLWIMLDEVAPDTAFAILGDGFTSQIVDRVDLTELTVQYHRRGAKPEDGERLPYKRPGEPLEDPVSLVRVFVRDAEVTHTVGEWPAAFWQKAGNGVVLFTTLGPRGWYRPRIEGDPRAKHSLMPQGSIATKPYVLLSQRFLESRQPATDAPAVLESLVAEKIGYKIVARRWVVMVLGGFCLIVVLAGVWLARARRLALLGIIGPFAALVAGLSLVLLGRAARTAVPPTIAVGQLAEIAQYSPEVRISGSMAMYDQKATNTVAATAGGVLVPDMTGQQGATRRMVWTDMDAWHWENMSLPAGTRQAKFQHATTLTDNIDARATFTPNGLDGSIAVGPFEQISDAIIATPNQGRMAVHLKPDGSFQATADDVLSAGQYLGGNLISDSQRRRSRVVEQLLAPRPLRRVPDRPTMLVWASPLDMGFRINDKATHVGDALVLVPLVLDRPSPGERLVIPSPFLVFEAVPEPGKVGRAPTYDNQSGQWLVQEGGFVEGHQTVLRFQVPEELLPAKVHEARLTVGLSAPSRSLAIKGFQDETPVELQTRESPLGSYDFTIDRADVLKLDSSGGLLLAVDVGDIEGGETEASKVGWQMHEVALQLTCETTRPQTD